MADHVQYHRMSDTPDLMLSEGLYSDYNFEPHYHLDYHIGLVEEGVQKQKFRGNSVLLGHGRISIMPPGEVHDGIRYQSDQYRMKTFRISHELLDEYFGEIFETDKTVEFGGTMIESPIIWQYLLGSFQIMQRDQALNSLQAEERWFETLKPLLANLCRKQTSDITKGQLNLAQLTKVKEFCRANLENKIILDQLADLCDLSRYQFLRKFEKRVGITPHNWLTQFRLEQACSELRKGKKPVVDIATEVGFYDQSHFSKAFKQAYGVAPSKY